MSKKSQTIHLSVKIFLSLLLILYAVGCSTTIDCSKYKTEKFVFRPIASKDTIYIERHDSSQIEIDAKTGKFVKSRVVWKTPCQYDLYGVNASDSDKNSPFIYFKTHPLHITIIGEGIGFYYISENYIAPNGKEFNLTNKVELFE
jgi:uncharacterized protein YcfL